MLPDPRVPFSYSAGGLRGIKGNMDQAMKRGGIIGPPIGNGGSPGGAGGGCVCASTDGSLKIVCCGSGCTFDCSASSNPSGTMTLGACGGEPPYSWTTTNGTIVSSGSNQATLTKPANPGSGVAGIAYRKLGAANAAFELGCRNDLPVCEGSWGCNDQVIVVCDTTALVTAQGCCNKFDLAPWEGQAIPAGTLCATSSACSCNTKIADKRTADMIAAGCVPCGLMSGAVVTVTDAVGTSAAKTLSA